MQSESLLIGLRGVELIGRALLRAEVCRLGSSAAQRGALYPGEREWVQSEASYQRNRGSEWDMQGMNSGGCGLADYLLSHPSFSLRSNNRRCVQHL